MELKRKSNIIRMMVKGGIITPSYFQKILSIARQAGNTTISFGSRQDIIFKLSRQNESAILEALSHLKIEFCLENNHQTQHQNIVSSFVAADIQTSTQWLNSGNYIQLLDMLNHPHQLRINITDPCQSMVPLFYGHLNLVASESKHYWHLYLRLPSKHKLTHWPELIFTNDIPMLCKAIEDLWLDDNTLTSEILFGKISNLYKLNTKKIDQPLIQSNTFSADYEGFGRMYESNKHWAGFYWRNNRYDIHFLESLCELCLKTGISQIAITPWKSFIVKGIQNSEMIQWQTLLGRNGITMRHSAFDLNWHLPLGNTSALKLKRYIAKQFDRQDVCVHGLTFGITNGREIPFCSVMIRENNLPAILRVFRFLRRYDILVAEQFNPNSCQYRIYEVDCPRHRLPQTLSRLTRIYYSQISVSTQVSQQKEMVPSSTQKVFQCPNCLTAYLPANGAPHLNILPGTSFEQLPQSYCCPVCETEKKSFFEVDLSIIEKK